MGQQQEAAAPWKVERDQLQEQLTQLQQQEATQTQQLATQEESLRSLTQKNEEQQSLIHTLQQELAALKEQRQADTPQEDQGLPPAEEPEDKLVIAPIRMKDIGGDLLYKIMAVYNDADEDGNQSIDFEEFKTCFKNLLPGEISDDELKKVFDTVDTDCSGELNFKEFCTAYVQFVAPPQGN